MARRCRAKRASAAAGRRIEQIELRPRRPKPLAETLEAIASGRSDHAGPRIAVHQRDSRTCWWTESRSAIAQSPALKAYFVNLMSQPGETTNFRASDHVAAILRHAGRACRRSLMDVCVVNTRPIAGSSATAIRRSAAQPVENDIENLERMGLRVIGVDLLRMAGQRRRKRSATIRASSARWRWNWRRRADAQTEAHIMNTNCRHSGRGTGNPHAIETRQGAASRRRTRRWWST